jgi:glycosyltransferase involved in cell wall biosynthesis
VARDPAAALAEIGDLGPAAGVIDAAPASIDGSSALAQRLRAAAAVLLDIDAVLRDVAEPDVSATLLDALVRHTHASLDCEQIWLLLVAVTAEFPTPDEVVDTRRRFEVSDPTDACLWLFGLLADGIAGPSRSTLQILTHRVIVEVDFSARHDLHTGIQRVVRTTVPIWERGRDIVTAVWTDRHTGLRALRPAETDRLLHWGADRHDHPAPDRGDGPDTVIVPWRSVIVLVEVPAQPSCTRLAAIAQHTGCRLVAIGYDCIPIVSADLVDIVEPNRFVNYLQVIKHSRRVAGISESATAEFRGFADMLPAQGLTGPQVSECVLPEDTVGPARSGVGANSPGPTELPVVLCIGSIERRKNQQAVLYAAEALWRAGVKFRLRFIGGGGSGKLIGYVRELQALGRPVSVETGISESELAAAFRRARCTVFASLHEGYGLPVAESLAFGVPAITTNYGSTREIGQGGGVEFVDPRDDGDVLRALRLLLTDDARHAELVAEIAARPQRTWQQYADELWVSLVQPELTALAALVAAAPVRSQR